MGCSGTQRAFHTFPHCWRGKQRSMSMFRNTAVFAATAISMVLGTAPVSAQDYRTVVYDDPTEHVTVTAPRPPQDRSTIGAPIVDVALSREVRIDDLDLRTGYGVRVLERRVSAMAQALCHRL